VYRLDEELLRGSSVDDAERSRDSRKFEYAGGVGAIMVDGSRNGRVPKLSSVVGASFVALEVPSDDVPGGESSGEASVAFSGATGVAGGGIADVVASLTAFMRFSLAAVQGKSGLTKELLA
jgi:hypothetical protein